MHPQRRVLLVDVEQPQGLANRPAVGRREVLGPQGPEEGSVTLRPVVVIPRDDAWSYTAEHLADVARALADIREGRVRRLSDGDLAAYD